MSAEENDKDRTDPGRTGARHEAKPSKCGNCDGKAWVYENRHVGASLFGLESADWVAVGSSDDGQNASYVHGM